jgi:hypothetical protein
VPILLLGNLDVAILVCSLIILTRKKFELNFIEYSVLVL